MKPLIDGLISEQAVTHPAVLRTARWPALHCPVCCGGGGSASWSCSTAWTGTEGFVPTRRTPPGPQPATARRTWPAETRRVPGTACCSVQTEDTEVTAALLVKCRSFTLSEIRIMTCFCCWLVLSFSFSVSSSCCCCCSPVCRQLEEAGGVNCFLIVLPPPPLPISLHLYKSPPLLFSSNLFSLLLLFFFALPSVVFFCLPSFISSPLLLSSMLKVRFLLDEKSIPVKPLRAH